MVMTARRAPCRRKLILRETRPKELKAGEKKQRIQPLILSPRVLKVLHVTVGIYKVHGFIVVYRL